MGTASAANVRPDLADPDADVSLYCKDGTEFRIHFVVLITTSGFFRALTTLPQPNTSPTERFTLHLEENSQTLESLFRMITGIEIPAFNSFDSVEAVLFAAEKYDMPGPISIIRSFMLSPTFITNPVHVYFLACRYGWRDVAGTAAILSLKLNIQDPKISELLSRLDSGDLMRLLQLHWRRKSKFRDALDSKEIFGEGIRSDLPCGHANTAAWPKLKLAMLREMEQCPALDAILSPGFLQWPDWKALTIAHCQIVHCTGRHRPLISSADETLQNIRSLVQSLPESL